MDPRTITRLMILRRLVESLPEDRREKNLPVLERTVDKIMGDLDHVIRDLVLLSDRPSKAPKECRIRGLSQEVG